MVTDRFSVRLIQGKCVSMLSIHNQLVNSYLRNVNDVVALTEHDFRTELIREQHPLTYLFLIVNLESNLILLQIESYLHLKPMGFHSPGLTDWQGYQHTLPLLVQTEQDVITTKIKEKIENLSFVTPLHSQHITDTFCRIQSHIEFQVKVVFERGTTVGKHIIGCPFVDRAGCATKSQSVCGNHLGSAKTDY